MKQAEIKELQAKIQEAVVKLKKGKKIGEAVPVGISEAKPKLLPRNPDTGQICRTFIANGTTYTILTPEEGVGIYRWTHFEKAKIRLGFSKTFQQIYDWVAKGVNMANGPITTLSDLRTHINNHFRPLLDGIIEMGEERYSTAFWTCTLFIVMEGEDITKWIQEDQQKKIEDWAKEGYSENDFFILCAGSMRGFAQKFRSRLQEIQEIEKVFPTNTNTNST